MRHAMANRRRNRQGGSGGPGHRPQTNKTTVFDSNGPDVRIRGTAFQIVDKYLALAKDAAASGDRVLAENYLQHAEHYQRVIGVWAEENPTPQRYYGDSQPRNTEEAGDEQPDVAVVTRPTRPQQPREDEDLGLPASILGSGQKAASEDEPRPDNRVIAG